MVTVDPLCLSAPVVRQEKEKVVESVQVPVDRANATSATPTTGDADTASMASNASGNGRIQISLCSDFPLRMLFTVVF